MLDYAPPPADTSPSDGGAPVPPVDPPSYRVTLPLAVPITMHARICAHVRRWMRARCRHTLTRGGRLSEDFETARPGGLELVRWTMSYKETITASIDFGRSGDAIVRVRRVVADGLGSRRGRMYPRSHLPPGLVPSLVREFGARRDRPLILRARILDQEDTCDLTTYLESPVREMPAVVVSPVAESDRPCFDADKLAEDVVGLAHVFSLADGWCAELLEEVLGKGFGCCGGSVRIYWPRLEPASGDIEDTWHPHAIWAMQRSFRRAVLESLGLWWRARDREEDERSTRS